MVAKNSPNLLLTMYIFSGEKKKFKFTGNYTVQKTKGFFVILTFVTVGCNNSHMFISQTTITYIQEKEQK